MYGYKGVKWLTRMELVADQPTGYWEGLGYDQNAWVGRSNGYGTERPRVAAALRAAPSAPCTGCTRPRSCILLGVRPLPLPAEPRRGRQPAAAPEGDPPLHRGRVGGRARRSSCSSATGARCARTAREVDRFDADDRAWLRGRRAPQGRLNAGQKLNAIVTAAFAILFAITGFFLWYGERDTRFRLADALLVHDWLMYVSFLLFLGHLYLALDPPEDAARAERHHARLGATRTGRASTTGSGSSSCTRQTPPGVDGSPPQSRSRVATVRQDMRWSLVIVLASGLLLVAAPVANAEPGMFVGVSDDSFEWNAASMAATANDLGLHAVRVTLNWTPGQRALSAGDRAALGRVVAGADGLRVVLAAFNQGIRPSTMGAVMRTARMWQMPSRASRQSTMS